MTERFDYPAGGGIVPVIPYDTFEAANLFLATGRTREEVLPLIGLNAVEWERLHESYRWFPYSLGERYRHDYFAGLDDAEIYRLVLPPRWRVQEGDEPELRATWHIREAVRRNPYIGPFKDCGWPFTFSPPAESQAREFQGSRARLRDGWNDGLVSRSEEGHRRRRCRNVHGAWPW
jgi:hypothetical protein